MISKIHFLDVLTRSIYKMKYSFEKMDMDDLELVKVIQVNRHGARTANMKAKLDVAFGSGCQLTSGGYRQHMDLGKVMRKKYINSGFIDPEKLSTQFEIITTKTQRTLYSAIGFANGFIPGAIPSVQFPNNDELKDIKNDDFAPIGDDFNKYKNNNISNKSINIKIIPAKGDTLFHAKNCLLNGVKIGDLIKKEKKKPFKDVVSEEDINDKEIMLNLTTISKEEEKNEKNVMKNLLKLSDEEMNAKNKKGKQKTLKDFGQLIIVQPYHFSADAYDPKILSDDARHLYVKHYIKKKYGNNFFNDEKYTYILVSHFYQNVIDEFDKAVNGKDDGKKYIVYSSHDGTLLPIMTTIIERHFLIKKLKEALDSKEAFEFISIPFASFFSFELYRSKSTGKYYIIFYYNGIMLEKYLRKFDKTEDNVSDDDGIIPYSEFKTLLEIVIDKRYLKLTPSDDNSEDEGR